MLRRHITRLASPLATLLTLLVGLVVLVPPGAAHAADDVPQALPPGSAWVRVGHFVPGMGETAISLQPLEGGEPVELAARAAYGDVSTYEKLAPGSYTATVRDSGTTSDSAPMLSRSFDVVAGASRTIAVVGTSSAPRLSLLTDDLTPPAAGTGRVRLLSASADAGPVTVTAINGPTIASGAVLGEATDYATVPAGTWALEIQGEMSGSAKGEVKIGSGSVYTVVVLDTADGSDGLQVVVDAAGAKVAPMGGAKTGMGGSALGSARADDPAGSVVPALLVGGILLLGLWARGRARLAR